MDGLDGLRAKSGEEKSRNDCHVADFSALRAGRPSCRVPAAPWNCRRSDASFLVRSEEHTSELQSRLHLVCRLLLEKKKHNSLMQLETPSTQIRLRATPLRDCVNRR